jgi:hypothetical protein
LGQYEKRSEFGGTTRSQKMDYSYGSNVFQLVPTLPASVENHVIFQPYGTSSPRNVFSGFSPDVFDVKSK